MVKAWKVLGLASLVGGGCIGPHHDQPMARAQFRVSSRQVELPAPASTPRAPLASSSTGALQFAVSAVRYLYVGGELEAGVFPRERSSYAGAYGVLGADAGASHAWVSVELVAGRQWLQHAPDTLAVQRRLLEPRLRAQFVLGRQVTLGAMLGANAMPDERGWTAGFFIGFYSDPVDGS
jgi:hypothetical protein